VKRRSVLIGGLLGVLTGTLVIWLTYLGYQLVNLPFPPFSLFDFVTRVLPGSVITVGIDTMVGLIVRLNVGSLARSAKLAERGIAYLQFILLGGVFGGFLGAFHRLRGSARLPVYGYGFGLLLAAVFVGVEAFLGFRTVGLGSSVAWLALVFGGWGLTLGWLLRGTFRARSESPEAGLSRRDHAE
jgi:hypothetical protein